jgi:hypothetical protein
MIRVKQLYISKVLVPAFQNDLLIGHNLDPYHSHNEPAIFYGVMGDDLENLRKNTSWKIIVWVGGDINYRTKNKKERKTILKKIELIKGLEKVRHIAISSFIANDLASLNIPFSHIPFMGVRYELFHPVTKGPCIYLYTDLFSEALYGEHIYKRIMVDYAHIKIIITCCQVIHDKYLLTHDHLPYSMMQTYDKKTLIEEIYPQCFIGLRLTEHDGLSGTVQELGMMGIKTIHNGSSPSALSYTSYQDVCDHIDREYSKIGETDWELSDRVKNYLRIDDEFFMVPDE